MSALRLSFIVLFCAAAPGSHAQLPEEEWELEDGYQTDLLYVHGLANYAWDGEWQFDWQRRQFADNALRINTGSVSSDQLLTDVDLNLNAELSPQFRFYGRFSREGFRRQPVRADRLLLGLEWLPFESSGVYVAVNPEFDKESIDLAVGYTFHARERERYLRVGLLVADFNWETKNQVGGTQSQAPLKVEWALRWPVAGGWWLYSNGRWGTGYERTFADRSSRPDLLSQDRNDNKGEIHLTREDMDRFWSVSLQVYEFYETATYLPIGFDYDYGNTQVNIGVEHIFTIRDKHRWRLLARYVEQQADSAGYRAHDYARSELVGGIFYERLEQRSAWSLAYAFGLPDIDYAALAGQPGYAQNEFTDKVIAGWRFEFSPDAQIRFTLSHEVSARGFGGGAVQYQMFF